MTRSRSIRILKHLSAVILIALAAPVYAQTFELSLEDGRVAARQAALTGNFRLARDLALALIEADPNDRAALVVLAAVQPQLSAPRVGRTAGVRAYQLSKSDDERYEAARLVALAAANEERYTLSQFWLRRAAINAPNDRAQQQTRSDYSGVRNLNPLSVNLGFLITPSNNVNGGTESELNIVEGLPGFVGFLNGAAQALPGTSAIADVRLRYAISRGADQRTSLTARAYARAVWLNSKAQATSPTSRNSDFGSQILEFGIDHQLRVGDDLLNAEALIGYSWFGGDLRAGYLAGTLGYTLTLTDRTRLNLTARLEQTYDPDPWTRDNQRASLSTQWTNITAGRNRLSTHLSFAAQSSDNVNERYESLTVQASYSWADPLGPVQLSVSGGVAYSEYRDYSILPGVPVPSGRWDTKVFGSVTALFQDLDYAGFVPTVTLGVQDTQSNVSRFERDEFSLNIGIRSSF